MPSSTPNAPPHLDKEALLVLGMHRSGTSALTRALNLLGVALPNKLLPNAEDNPTGHWEPEEIVAFNQKVLGHFHLDWHTTQEIPWHQCSEAQKNAWIQQALDLLKSNYPDSKMFVLKDPRICRLMPIWQPALSAFAAQIKVIFILRHPLEVAASLQKREEKNTFVEDLLLWLLHVQEAEASSRSMQRVFVCYEKLLQQPQQTLEHIQYKLQLHWPTPPTEQPQLLKTISNYISIKLQNHHHQQQDTIGYPHEQLPEIIEHTYQHLQALSHNLSDASTLYHQQQLKHFADLCQQVQNTYLPVLAQYRQRIEKETQKQRQRSRYFHGRFSIVQAQNAALKVLISSATGQQHFATENDSGFRFGLEAAQVVLIIVESGLFDAEHYLSISPDLEKQDLNPLIHFVLFGASENRQPNKEQTLKQWLKQFPTHVHGLFLQVMRLPPEILSNIRPCSNTSQHRQQSYID